MVTETVVLEDIKYALQDHDYLVTSVVAAALQDHDYLAAEGITDQQVKHFGKSF